jgi:hypothetical protein
MYFCLTAAPWAIPDMRLGARGEKATALLGRWTDHFLDFTVNGARSGEDDLAIKGSGTLEIGFGGRGPG